MTAEPAPEIKVQVDRVLASIDVPSFELNLKEVSEDDGPPVKTIKLSQALFEKFARESNFYAIASVQVRDLNHRVYSATLMDDEGPVLVCREDCPLSDSEVVAIRKAPGWLLGWLIKPKWIES